MSLDSLIFIFVALVGCTGVYKFMPYRSVPEKKPVFVWLPKYKKHIHHAHNQQELESRVMKCGFIKAGEKNGFTYFERGSWLGDFSIKLAKVRVGIKALQEGMAEITMEAGWVVAFDTGDFWTEMTKLSAALETKV